MPRVNIPVAQITPYNEGAGGFVSPTWVDADSANDHEFINDGRTFLLVSNSAVGASTSTIVSVADMFGRLGNITLTIPAQVSASRNSITVAGPFRVDNWNQAAGTKVYIDTASAITVAFAAFKAA